MKLIWLAEGYLLGIGSSLLFHCEHHFEILTVNHSCTLERFRLESRTIHFGILEYQWLGHSSLLALGESPSHSMPGFVWIHPLALPL